MKMFFRQSPCVPEDSDVIVERKKMTIKKSLFQKRFKKTIVICLLMKIIVNNVRYMELNIMVKNKRSDIGLFIFMSS